MNLKLALAGMVIATASATAVLAQQPSATGDAAISSEPGKASAARTVHLSAEVVRVDKATRTVTLKGPRGNTVDVVAGDEVKNFDQIKVGDFVVARYTVGLSLALRKTKGASGELTVTERSTQAKPGEQPGATGVRQIRAIAQVTAVDPKASTITLKGPQGNVVTLDVHNPDQFKLVKKGDQVEVIYTQALALSVEPAPTRKK